MRRTVMALIALCALPMFPALAHEFWLAPATFRPKVGEIVGIKTLVGDHYVGESRPRDPTKLEKFVLATPEGEVKIIGRDGLDPAGFIRIGSAGTFAAGYRSKNTRVVLAGDKFEAYLKEKGLDNAIEARKAAGKSAEDGRERFSRCAKSLICVGDAPSKGFDHAFKFPLELIPQADPYTLHAGDSFTMVLHADGKAKENVLVEGWVTGKSGVAVSGRTDKNGKVTFKLDTKGEWMFNATTISRVEEKDADVDWESLWASLTFDLAEKKDAAPAVPATPAADVPAVAPK